MQIQFFFVLVMSFVILIELMRLRKQVHVQIFLLRRILTRISPGDALKVLIKITGTKGQEMKQFKVGDIFSASVAFQDAGGFAAKVDGAPKWGVSDEALASLVVSEDGMSASGTVLAPGSFKVLLTADADLGEGLKEIPGESEELVALAGEAEKVIITIA